MDQCDDPGAVGRHALDRAHHDHTASTASTASTKGVLRQGQAADHFDLQRYPPGDRRHGHQLPAGLVHGIVTRRFTIDLTGAGRVFGVKFRPGGFTAFTGRQFERDVVVRLETLFGQAGGRLVRDVLAEPDDVDRAAVADAFLAGHVPEPDTAYLQLLDLLAEMVSDRSITRTAEVARRASMTPRTLQRLFHRYVGVGPKWVLSRYRLQDAAAAIDEGAVTDLASLAADLGWFDQAHFSRDVREVVGVTPSRYLSDAQRSRQQQPDGQGRQRR